MFKPVFLSAFATILVGLGAVGANHSFAEEPTATDAPKIDGRELFVREWVPNDSRSHGGDGLGPVFNDTSCVACHNQGGVGGAGPRGKNATIITAFKNAQGRHMVMQRNEGALSRLVGSLFGTNNEKAIGDESPEEKEAKKKEIIRKERERLTKLHPGFRTARSVVLHHFGTDDKYASFRSRLNGAGRFGGFAPAMTHTHGIALDQPAEVELQARAEQATRRALASRQMALLKQEAQMAGAGQFFGPSEVDGFVFLRTERNAIALFGSGKIDSIPEQVIIDTSLPDGVDSISGITRFSVSPTKLMLPDAD